MHNLVLQRSIANLSAESVEHSRLAFDVSDRIASILRKKGLSTHDLAVGLNTTESEVSKWLGGTQNFTLGTIARIQAFLGEKLLIVPQ